MKGRKSFPTKGRKSVNLLYNSIKIFRRELGLKYKCPLFKPMYLNLGDLTHKTMNKHMISRKMNGPRKYLIIDHDGTMFLSGGISEEILKVRSTYSNIIIECILREDKPSPLILCDIVRRPEHYLNLEQRIELLKGIYVKLEKELEKSGFKTELFEYYDVEQDTSSFFETVNMLLDTGDRDDYHGLLFTHKTKYGDAFKWKFPLQNSIDFYTLKGNKLGVLTKEGIKPYKNLTYLDEDKKTKLDEVWSFEKHNNQWIPIYYRTDKTHDEKPNFIDVADEIMEIIKDPIAEETMRGTDDVLLDLYLHRTNKSIEDMFEVEYREESYSLITDKTIDPDTIEFDRLDIIVFFGLDQELIDKVKDNDVNEYINSHKDRILNFPIPPEFKIILEHYLDKEKLLSPLQMKIASLYRIVVLHKDIKEDKILIGKNIRIPYFGIINYTVLENTSFLKSILYLLGNDEDELDDKEKSLLNKFKIESKKEDIRGIMKKDDLDLQLELFSKVLGLDVDIILIGGAVLKPRVGSKFIATLLYKDNEIYPCGIYNNTFNEYGIMLYDLYKIDLEVN